MKKYFYLLAIALVSMAFCSCGSDDDDPKPAEFNFVAPYMEWGSSLDDVRTFMTKNLPDIKEKDSYSSTDGTVYRFKNKSENVTYSYTFKDNKLLESGIDYTGKNIYFNDFKEQVSKLYNIKEWESHPKMAGITFWTETIIFDGSNYYGSSFYNSYYNYLNGYGSYNNGYNSYENYYDSESDSNKIQKTNVSIGYSDNYGGYMYISFNKSLLN